MVFKSQIEDSILSEIWFATRNSFSQRGSTDLKNYGINESLVLGT
jgi:hypothetical protein